MFSGVKDQKQWLPFVPTGWDKKVLPREIPSMMGMLQTQKGAFLSLVQVEKGTGQSLCLSAGSGLGRDWCCTATGHAESRLLFLVCPRMWSSCASSCWQTWVGAKRASQSRSCMAAFARSVHGGERLRLHLI